MNTPPPMVAEIQLATCAYFGLSMHDLLTDCRARELARPRQIGMYLAREMTAQSLPEIGRRFGGRDHTTVLHGVRQIRGLVSAIPEVGQDVRRVREITAQIASYRQATAA